MLSPYLLYFQVLLEAGCLEWSVVVAVVLRDALAVLRVVTLARAPDVPAQVITRLTTGLQDLLHFTNTEWYVVLSNISFMCILI